MMSAVIECQDCGSTGYVRTVRDGVSGVTDCRCTLERIARKKRFNAGEGPWPLPEKLRKESLHTFECGKASPTIRAAFKGAQKFAENPSGGILFSGDVGSGKSHLAAGILKAVNVEAFFVNVPELMLRLRGTFNADELDRPIIDDLRRVPLLVLDDMGADRVTEYAAEMLYLILNARWDDEKPLIITTNKLVFADEGKAGNLRDYLQERTYSRLKGICWNESGGYLNCFEMHGADRRYGK